jgi:hypothetical protein
MTGTSPGPAAWFGYLIGSVVNTALLWAINVDPGWASVPFLTEETPHVLALVNISLAASVIASLVYLQDDSPRVRALGGIITTTAGLLAAARILQVFPVDLDEPYDTVVRTVLVVAVVGAAIGIIVNLVSWFTSDRGAPRSTPASTGSAR